MPAAEGEEMNVATTIKNAFSKELNIRFGDIRLAPNFVANSNSELIEKYQNSQLNLLDISSPDIFFLIEADPLNWLTYADEELFLQLLPLFMLVAANTHRIDVENLRGFLLGYLTSSKYSSDSQLSIMNHIYESISVEQKAAVQAFILKYE